MIICVQDSSFESVQNKMSQCKLKNFFKTSISQKIVQLWEILKMSKKNHKLISENNENIDVYSNYECYV